MFGRRGGVVEDSGRFLLVVAAAALLGAGLAAGQTIVFDPGGDPAASIPGVVDIQSGEYDADSTPPALDVGGAWLRLGDADGATSQPNGLGLKFTDLGESHGTLWYDSANERFVLCESSGGDTLTCDSGSETLRVNVDTGEVTVVDGDLDLAGNALDQVGRASGEGLAYDAMDDGIWFDLSFSTGSGSTVHNHGGKTYDGETLHGTAQGGYTWTDGLVGGGMTFDGSSGTGIDLGHAWDDHSEPVTISLWFDEDEGSTSAGDRIISQDCSEWFCFNDDGTDQFEWYVDGSAHYTTSVDEAGWHHMVLVMDAPGGEIRMYLDGQLRHTHSIGSWRHASRPIVVAGNTEGFGDISGSEWSGTMDEIKIFNRALAPREVRRLHDGRWAARTCSDVQGGDGVYTIDPDGPGGADAFDVYCRGGETRLNLYTRQWGNSNGFPSPLPDSGYGERQGASSSHGGEVDGTGGCSVASQVSVEWRDADGNALTDAQITALNAVIAAGRPGHHQYGGHYYIYDDDEQSTPWTLIKGCHDGEVVMAGLENDGECGNTCWSPIQRIEMLSGVFTTGIFGCCAQAGGVNVALPRYWYFG